MNKLIKSGSIILISVLLFSCSEIPLGIQNTNTINAKQNSMLINGKVDFSNKSNSNKFGLKASSSDISSDATVSLMYPFNHFEFPNKTIATGLTDENGNFTINPGSSGRFSIGEIYVLEASKRFSSDNNSTDDSGKSLISLRTYIQWDGIKWKSITTNGIYINTLTTSYALISPDKVKPQNTIDRIDSSSNTMKPNSILLDEKDGNGNPLYKEVDDILFTEKLIKLIIDENLNPVQFYNPTGIGSIRKELNPQSKIFTTTKDCVECDLRDLEIKNGEDFSNANFYKSKIWHGSFSGPLFEFDTLGNFTNTNFGETVIKTTEMYMSDFSNANFENTFFEKVRVEFSNFNFANFKNSNFTSSEFIFSKFTGANLSNVNFGNSNLAGSDFTDAILTEANFSNTTYEDDGFEDFPKFDNADLSGAIWFDGKVCAEGSIGNCN